jgi:hypothetical protein
MNLMTGFPSILDFKFSFTASLAIGFNIVTDILHDYIYAENLNMLQFLNKKPLRHSGHNLRGESSNNGQGFKTVQLLVSAQATRMRSGRNAPMAVWVGYHVHKPINGAIMAGERLRYLLNHYCEGEYAPQTISFLSAELPKTPCKVFCRTVYLQ